MATASLTWGSVCSYSVEAQGRAATGLSRDGSSSSSSSSSSSTSTVHCPSLGCSNFDANGTLACRKGLRVSVTGGRGRRRPGLGSALTVVRAMRASGGDRKEEKRIVENIPSSPPQPSTTTNSVGVEDEDIEKDDRLAAEAFASEAGTTESKVSERKQDENISDSPDSIDEIGTAISELRKERTTMGYQDPSSTTDFWRGVTEETKLIDWPVFSKVLGTTGVVVAMILGSSVVLLTVNAVLAASSDFIFNDPAIKEFAKNQLNLSF